jgi:hypothetical protein
MGQEYNPPQKRCVWNPHTIHHPVWWCADECWLVHSSRPHVTKVHLIDRWMDEISQLWWKCKLERMNDPIKMMFTLAHRWVNKVRIALLCCCCCWSSYQLQKVITDKNVWVGYPFRRPTQGWLQKLYLGHGPDPTTLMGGVSITPIIHSFIHARTS